jgi:hypothetical protein
MQKYIAVIVPKLTHHLKSAKYNFRDLEKWIETYEFAWRRIYGNIPKAVTHTLIPKRWRIIRLIDPTTKELIKRIRPGLWKEIEEKNRYPDYTKSLYNMMPEESNAIIKFT